MADPWIKMRVTLDTNPTVVRIAKALDLPDGMPHVARVACAVGLLQKTWSLADTQTVDGVLMSYDRDAVDATIGIRGWCAILESVGWLVVDAEGVTIPDFDEHNGKSAKKRAQTAKRNRTLRSRDAERDAESVTDRDAVSVTLSSSSSSSCSHPVVEGGAGGRSDFPATIGARLAQVLARDLGPLDGEARALVVRLDAQTREARADDGGAKSPEIGAAAWRKALHMARTDLDRFRRSVELTEERSAKNLQDAGPPVDESAPNIDPRSLSYGVQDRLAKADDERRLEEWAARKRGEVPGSSPTAPAPRVLDVGGAGPGPHALRRVDGGAA